MGTGVVGCGAVEWDRMVSTTTSLTFYGCCDWHRRRSWRRCYQNRSRRLLTVVYRAVATASAFGFIVCSSLTRLEMAQREAG
eukprot:6196815-Pleurochrysis_carterae.AAC.4